MCSVFYSELFRLICILTFTDIDIAADYPRLVAFVTPASPVTNAIDTMAMCTDVGLVVLTFVYIWK